MPRPLESEARRAAALSPHYQGIEPGGRGRGGIAGIEKELKRRAGHFLLANALIEERSLLHRIDVPVAGIVPVRHW
jgi:hypothetical protein